MSVKNILFQGIALLFFPYNYVFQKQQYTKYSAISPGDGNTVGSSKCFFIEYSTYSKSLCILRCSD